MARSLLELRREIMTGDLSIEGWLRLDQEVKEAFANASETEIEEFVDSGAGESLDMICSAYRGMNN